jgi:hypothetical protein
MSSDVIRHWCRGIVHTTAILAIALSSCKQRRMASSVNSEVVVEKVGSPLDQLYDIVLNFSGKGTAVVWDLGVLKGLIPRVLPLQQNRAIFTGNSSGSMMAAYFSCFGLSAESLQNAIEGFSRLDRSQIPEDKKLKTSKLTKGNRAESHAGYLESFASDMLTKDNRRCIPVHPLVIVAANGDVLENRTVEGNGPLIKPHRDEKQ